MRCRHTDRLGGRPTGPAPDSPLGDRHPGWPTPTTSPTALPPACCASSPTQTERSRTGLAGRWCGSHPVIVYIHRTIFMTVNKRGRPGATVACLLPVPVAPDPAVWESWRERRPPPTGVGSPNTSRGRADNRSSQTSRSGSRGVTAACPTGDVFNTSRGRADNRSSQTSRSGSPGVTAAYPTGDVLSTSGAELTTARPRPRGLGVLACRPPTPLVVSSTPAGQS